MSGLGKPLCQQVLDKHGVEESMQYNSIARFAFGDLTEALLMLVMREAGIDIVDFQKEVALEIEGVVVKGTLDVIIRGTRRVLDFAVRCGARKLLLTAVPELAFFEAELDQIIDLI